MWRGRRRGLNMLFAARRARWGFVKASFVRKSSGVRREEERVRACAQVRALASLDSPIPHACELRDAGFQSV